LLTFEFTARLTFNAFIEIVLIEGRPALSCFLNNSISCVRTPVAGHSRQNSLTSAGHGLGYRFQFSMASRKFQAFEQVRPDTRKIVKP